MRTIRSKHWETATGREALSLKVPSSESFKGPAFSAIGFSPDGRLFATGGMDSPPALWETATARMLRPLAGSSNWAHHVSFNADGTRLNSGAHTQWDLATGRGLRLVRGATRRVYAVPSADGKLLVEMTPNTDAVRIVEVATGRTLHTLAPPAAAGGVVTHFALSPDGRLLAAGGTLSESDFNPMAIISAMESRRTKPEDSQKMFMDAMRNMKVTSTGQVTLWDAVTGQMAGVLSGHDKGVEQVAFSGDGRWLASSSTSNTIKIWDVVARREARTLSGLTAHANSMAFSADSRLLASAGDDGSTTLWDLQTGERLATLISLYDGGDWLVVTPDGLFDGSPAAWDQILWRFSQNTFDVAPVETFFNEFF
ncbi:MAG: hypothetical protein H0T60_10600, partial [Acidobacteria bacterium]|nr:hypothetical protein [Acidobacteriota bacterium]